MAPPPEYDKEPKAPDKSVTGISTDDSKILYNHVKDQSAITDPKSATATGGASAEVENNKHVETLDDGQLRALLDEAITYKCPKDREGKSSLFKELLEEVEQDEQACEAARGAGGAAGPGRAARRDRRRDHHSSLQDLVAAMAGEPAPRRGRAAAAHAPPASVSARALHGGSLPSGVDTSFLLGEEGGARGSYLATVRVVNPPPLAERRVSASDAQPPPADDPAARRSKPTFPMTYTARATLEIGSGSVGSGRAVTTTTASNQVDSAVPFGCITSPEVVGCGAAPASADPKPRSVISSGYNGLPLSRPADDYKKSLDENGNSVQGSGQPKKPRRKKASKNETVIKSHQIDGYQGNKDLDELLRFIESNDDAGRPKLRAKHKDDCDDKAAKKRSTERRKDRDAKPKRASSLEELSRTTLEDLTDEPAPREPRRAPHAPAKPERRSWGDDARALLARAPAADSDAPELTDFQTVTKKRKPRRRHDDAEREPAPRRARRSPGPRSPRRAPPPSAPASDRSDSNDDMDSLHSQPAAPPPPAPHASYADIARTRHNIPDLIESCNFYAEGEAEARGAGAAAADADQYPALEPRRARDKRPPQPPARAPREEPDVLADRRPPVVLLDSGARPGDLDGVTFGFDVNEQLLGGPRRARCDLLRDAPEHAPPAAPHAPRPPCALRYVAPEPPADVTQLHRIIDYISAAWDDVLRCGGGKALYYSE